MIKFDSYIVHTSGVTPTNRCPWYILGRLRYLDRDGIWKLITTVVPTMTIENTAMLDQLAGIQLLVPGQKFKTSESIYIVDTPSTYHKSRLEWDEMTD